MTSRKKRNEVYKTAIGIMNDLNIPLGNAMRRAKGKGSGDYWSDSNSPTGYSQVCSYDAYGTCQFPCNGDC